MLLPCEAVVFRRDVVAASLSWGSVRCVLSDLNKLNTLYIYMIYAHIIYGVGDHLFGLVSE